MGKRYPAPLKTCPFRCARKMRFESKDVAEIHSKTYALNLKPYQCNHCKEWHLSSDSRDEFTGRRKK